MNIENLQRAEQLHKELDALTKGRDFLDNGGYVEVHGKDGGMAFVADEKAKECLKVGIKARIEEIHDEIRKL